MSKLYRARSLLYLRQILQVNIRWNSYLFEKKIEKRDMGSVGKLLTRSTRFTCFCTAQTSIFQKKIVKLFRIFRQTFAKLTHFRTNFHWILLRAWWNFVGISQIFSKMLKKKGGRVDLEAKMADSTTPSCFLETQWTQNLLRSRRQKLSSSGNPIYRTSNELTTNLRQVANESGMNWQQICDKLLPNLRWI